MPFAFGTSVADIVLRKNVDAAGGILRAELWRMPSKRDGLTLSQRGFAVSVHTSSLGREKKSAVDQPLDLQILAMTSQLRSRHRCISRAPMKTLTGLAHTFSIELQTK